MLNNLRIPWSKDQFKFLLEQEGEVRRNILKMQ